MHGFRFPEEVADAPTYITGARQYADLEIDVSATTADREDPTDVSSPALETSPHRRQRVHTATAEIVLPRSRWKPSTLTNAVVQRMRPSSSSVSTWLWLCVLFAIAVSVAIAIALL
jgi:hypothetical protein